MREEDREIQQKANAKTGETIKGKQTGQEASHISESLEDPGTPGISGGISGISETSQTPEDARDNYTRGSLAAFLSAVGFGSLPIFAVFAYQEGVSVLTLLSFRFFFSSIFLAVFMLRRGIKFLPARSSFFGLLKLGIIYTIFNFAYFSAFELIPASLAALIFYAYPALVALLAFIQGEEKLSWTRAAAISAAFFGIYLVYHDFTAVAVLPGLIAAFSSAIFYAFYVLAGSSSLKSVRLPTVVLYTCLLAAVSFLIAGGLLGELNFALSRQAFLSLTAITLVSLSGLLLFLYGVKNTSPTIASVASMVEPVVTVFLSLLILAETFSSIQYIGGLLVIAASAYIVIKRA